MIESQCSKKYNKHEIKILHKYANIFYKDIQKSYNYIKNLEVICEEKDLSFKYFSNYTYFPKEIKDYIYLNNKTSTQYKTKINGKNIALVFVDFNKNHLQKKIINQYANLVFLTIYLLSLYTSKKCSKNLSINIFLTPFKKELPLYSTDILGINNVNSGFSTIGCNNNGEITIYRQEEWFKVLIHELFHNLNLDFSTMNIEKWKKILFNNYKINSTYEIFETYCETWARILNIAISSFFITNSREKFIKKFNFLIELERNFSLIQARKILKRFKNIDEYREKSNVFCYYILTSVLINNYLEFFIWCDANNNNFIKFKNTEQNLQSFVELLLRLTNKNFESNLKCISEFSQYSLNNSLRMTII